MMHPEWHVWAGETTLVVSPDGFEPYVSLGGLTFDKPKHFHYDWHVQYMDRDALQALRDALDAALVYLDSMPEDGAA
jgi:hypothetical protein